MIGTFFYSEDKNSGKGLGVGDKFSKGDVLGYIETMRLMNEIKAGKDEQGLGKIVEAGEIIEICVSNGHPIEWGQVLYKIRPLK